MLARTLTAAALGLFLPLHLPAAHADDAPEVKTGVRIVATVSFLPGVPTDKFPPPVPAKGTAIKVFPEVGAKAVVEAKTDDMGMFVVALPAGKYRVQLVPTGGPPGAPPVKLVEVKEGEVSEIAFHFVIALP